MIFCDTSLLLSLYVADRWSEEATRLVSTLRVPLVWTPWHELEISAALEARVGRGLTSREEADNIYPVLRRHRDDGFFRVVYPHSWPEVFRLGSALAMSHGAKHLNRGMDVLHVALCKTLKVETFWSMDDRQRALAEDVGLIVNHLD